MAFNDLVRAVDGDPTVKAFIAQAATDAGIPMDWHDIAEVTSLDVNRQFGHPTGADLDGFPTGWAGNHLDLRAELRMEGGDRVVLHVRDGEIREYGVTPPEPRP